MVVLHGVWEGLIVLDDVIRVSFWMALSGF